jgi:hypothetical protein
MGEEDKLKELGEAVHDLDKRLFLTESNLKRIDDLTVSVVAKLDNLADRIVVSLSKMIDERVRLHAVECKADKGKSVGDSPTTPNQEDAKQFSEWIIRSLIGIIMLLLGIVGKTYLGN